MAPYQGDSNFILIQDTADANGRWNAGCSASGPCETKCQCDANGISLIVSSWTNNEIDIRIASLTGPLGGVYSFSAGDRVEIFVWNPQTGTGPGHYALTVTAPSPPPHPGSITRFVDQMENLLVQSNQERRKVKNVVANADACRTPAVVAAGQIADVAASRQRALAGLSGIQAPTPQAASVVNLLRQALNQSLSFDRDYRVWLLSLVARGQTHCPLPQGQAFNVAHQEDLLATAAKQQFVDAFNPLAIRYGARTWTALDV